MKKKQSPKIKILVILGPTASGKSDLAVKIALRLSSGQAKKKFGINGAEIISADSRQVYKGLNIGSGKITKKEMRGTPHYLLDIASPKRTFTVSQYQKLAGKKIKEILKRGKIPIICGGTGFYIDALIYDYKLPEVPPQPKLRRELEKKSAIELFKQLKKLDSQRAKNIDRFNKRRLIRALEIVLTTKKPVPPHTFLKESKQNYDILFIGIKKPQEELKKLIAKRLKKRLKQGMLKEVEKLHKPFGSAQGKSGVSWKKLESFGLEYRWLARYLQNKVLRQAQDKSAYQTMVSLLQKDIEHYAKRQMTWFKRNKNINWVENYKETKNLTNKFIY